MTNWKLKINIKEEIEALKNLCSDLPQEYVFENETEEKYMTLVKSLETKFKQYEENIKEITDDDGTWENIERELEDMVMAYDIDNSNYCMENIYQECDYARVLLVQN